jgi:nicotinamide riboside kinase
MEEIAQGMLKKIALTGTESSGKTTLCRQLANHFKVLWVPEMARIVLERDGPHYDAAKVEQMALLQLEAEQETENRALSAGHPWLFCDTEMTVYRVWMEERFGFCPEWIREKAAGPGYDLILLLKPDLPWETDPLRENPRDRNKLHVKYESILSKTDSPCKSIDGAFRFEMALKLIGEIPL